MPYMKSITNTASAENMPKIARPVLSVTYATYGRTNKQNMHSTISHRFHDWLSVISVSKRPPGLSDRASSGSTLEMPESTPDSDLFGWATEGRSFSGSGLCD